MEDFYFAINFLIVHTSIKWVKNAHQYLEMLTITTS